MRQGRRFGFVWMAAAATVMVAGSAAPSAAASPPTWRFAARSSGALPGRVLAATAGAGDGQSVVRYGGEIPGSGGGSGQATGDTWVYAPATGWVAKCGATVPGATTPCGPGPRTVAGMAGGPTGVVLFGGSSDALGNNNLAPLSDTWVWNGTMWTEMCASACGPSGRVLAAMAGNGSKVVLFGGISSNGAPDDTWVFDGHSWSQTCGSPLALACGPPGLVGPAMAWDGSQFVMAGGAGVDQSGIGTPVDDTWTFDGASSRRVCGTAIAKPCGPPARAIAGFAYEHQPDPSLQGAVLSGGGDLFGGGSRDQTLLRDAWFWRAGSWTQLPTPWDASPVTFPESGDPPVGAAPLVSILGTQPALCQVLVSGAGVTTETPTLGVAAQTFSGGWDLGGTGQPSGCTAPAPVVPAGTPVVAPAPAAPILPATGAPIPPIAALGVVALVTGLVLRRGCRDGMAGSATLGACRRC